MVEFIMSSIERFIIIGVALTFVYCGITLMKKNTADTNVITIKIGSFEFTMTGKSIGMFFLITSTILFSGILITNTLNSKRTKEDPGNPNNDKVLLTKGDDINKSINEPMMSFYMEDTNEEDDVTYIDDKEEIVECFNETDETKENIITPIKRYITVNLKEINNWF